MFFFENHYFETEAIITKFVLYIMNFIIPQTSVEKILSLWTLDIALSNATLRFLRLRFFSQIVQWPCSSLTYVSVCVCVYVKRRKE